MQDMKEVSNGSRVKENSVSFSNMCTALNGVWG